MAQKPRSETFISSWNKTINWAKQNNIPYAAYYPVYQLDSQKFLQGGGLSEGERIQAIEASAGLNYSTALPQDSRPMISGTLDINNIKSNLADIFTGLEPNHLLSNIFDTIKGTIEHPSTITNVLFDPSVAHTAQIANSNNILNWIPGVYDVSKIMQGASGQKQLADTPVTALLDVVPFGRLASEVVGRTPLGAAMAQKAGIPIAEFRQQGIYRSSFQAIKEAKWPGRDPRNPDLPKHPRVSQDANGNVSIAPMTLDERINAIREVTGMSSNQADLLESMMILNERGTELVETITRPVLDSIGKLNQNDFQSFMHTAYNDHRPLSEILNDDNLTQPVKDTYQKAWDWTDQYRQIKMRQGGTADIPQPFNGPDGQPLIEHYVTKPGSTGAKLLSLTADSDRAQKDLNTASRPIDGMIYTVQSLDKNAAAQLEQLHGMQQAVFDSIKRSIPAEGESAAERLRGSLSGDRWDRAVPEQTPFIRNLLGLDEKPPDPAQQFLNAPPGPTSMKTWTQQSLERYLQGKPEPPPARALTRADVNNILSLFQSDGLLYQMYDAFKNQDWVALNRAAKAASRVWDHETFQHIPTDGRNVLNQARQLTTQLRKYATRRQSLTTSIISEAKSIARLSRKAALAHQRWVEYALQHPPDVWMNIQTEMIYDRIGKAEEAATAMDKIASHLHSVGFSESSVTQLRKDPRMLIETAANLAKNTFANDHLPDIDYGYYLSVVHDVQSEIGSLRARGHEPLYIPAVSYREMAKGEKPSFNVFVAHSLMPKSRSEFEKTIGMKSSIYDVQAGILEATKEIVTQDITQAFIDNSLKPNLFPAEATINTVAAYYDAEMADEAATVEAGNVRRRSSAAIIESGLKRMGLKKFDPGPFGAFSHPSLDADWYINENLEKAFIKSVNNFQLPASGIWDKGTKIFRFSILGFSPKYTAHIVFGGSMLVALRGNPGMFKFIPEAIHIARHGAMSDKWRLRHPGAADLFTPSTTQEGQAEVMWHYASAAWGGQTVINEWLSNHNLANTVANRAKAATTLNFRFTRAVVQGQRGLVYLAAAERALKTKKPYFEDTEVPRVDSQGNPVYHPTSVQLGNPRQIIDTVRSEVPMTPERAHEVGMQAVMRTMGELRHMTPLERQLLTKMFPFYGWTKHVLTYVMKYPFDHPYRAFFLSQLAEQNSLDQSTGLPTRLQLLLFLGHPDQYGNTTGYDIRAFDPLRDTANYASALGFFQSLTPMITAPFAMIDPSVTFAGQSLYPNVSFNELYGVKTGGAGGNVWNVAEQFVPQVTAIDAAFNLSGQYAYLRQNDPAAFSKKVFEALALPLTPQKINVRQMAAQGEIDRFSQASTDARNAVNTGDFSTLSQYPGTVPDPLNTGYEVTPAYLQSLYNYSEQKYGLPPTEALTPPPNPPL